MFNDYQSLIEELKKKSKNYPLIAKLYIPIIENYAQKYPNHTDIDDWLCIPWFEFLYKQRVARLDGLEKELQDIGTKNFEELCTEIIESTSHPVINGIHDKLFDKQAELWGMLKYSSKGYSVEKIKRSNKESRPDLRATKGDSTCIIECKFIHASNRIKTFTTRYARFLSVFCSEYKGNELLIMRMYFEINSEQPHELTQDIIDLIKNFVKEIVYKKLSTHEITLHYNVKGKQHSCKIDYRRDRRLGPSLVTFENQLKFAEQQLKTFHDGYVSRLVQKARNKQLAKAKLEGISTCLFIYIQFDESLSPLWLDELESIKNKIFGKDVSVIIKDVSRLI